MSIISFEFVGFALACVLLYYLLPLRFRYLALLAASAAFYCLAGWQGGVYLLAVTALTYGGAIGMARMRENEKRLRERADGPDKTGLRRCARARRALLAALLTLCFGALLLLKYYDPLRRGLNDWFSAWQWGARLPALSLLAPLGVSYFTFQSAGYLIDAYRGKLQPERNPLKYLLFVSFFPQIVQGPISSWKQLSPQLMEGHRFDPERFVSGATLALWGYFKKLVIADRVAFLVTAVTKNPAACPGWIILLAILAYSVQLYADFSGGIDIVRGVARMLGVDMTENFRRPFFAVSVADYWRRWHISLGVWFRTYLFYPLTASKAGLAVSRFGQRLLGAKAGRALSGALATVVIFLLIGIWHTASWNAVLYGLYFGLVMGVSLLLEPTFKALRKKLSLRDASVPWHAFRILRTVLLILPAQYFAVSMAPGTAFAMLRRTLLCFDFSTLLRFSAVQAVPFNGLEWIIALAALLILLVVDILTERGLDLCGGLARARLYVRWPVLLALIFAVLILGRYGYGYDSAAFVYTQF